MKLRIDTETGYVFKDWIDGELFFLNINPGTDWTGEALLFQGEVTYEMFIDLMHEIKTKYEYAFSYVNIHGELYFGSNTRLCIIHEERKCSCVVHIITDYKVFFQDGKFIIGNYKEIE